MAQMPHSTHAAWGCGCVFVSESRGPMVAFEGAGPVSRQRLATDSIGVTTLTLTNLVVGSAIRIEVASTGALVEARTATLTTEAFTLPYYAGGNAANDLRIKVRKGSANPKYQPFETQATLSSSSQSIFVAQVPDPIA